LKSRAGVTAVSSNPETKFVPPLGAASLADGFALVERHNLRVKFVLMNARDYADLRKFGRDILNDETQAVMLKQGLMGTIWGAHVIVDRAVSYGTAIILDENIVSGSVDPRGVALLKRS